ncbi:MAG: NfeD family protein [Rhodospirillales bacterium]
MGDLLNEITFWHWLILGVVLVIGEAVIPGAVLLWMGVAALVTGLVELAIPNLGWQIQCLVFAVLSIISVYFGRGWMLRRGGESDHPTLNRRGAEYIGRTYRIDTAIENGVGRLQVDDTFWKILAKDDLPAGSRVTVTGMQGMALEVEPASD